jgi:hypothetical protein
VNDFGPVNEGASEVKDDNQSTAKTNDWQRVLYFVNLIMKETEGDTDLGRIQDWLIDIRDLADANGASLPAGYIATRIDGVLQMPAAHEDAAPTDDDDLQLELESVYSAIELAIGQLIPPFDGEKDIDGNDLSIANARGILQELSYGNWKDFDPRDDDSDAPTFAYGQRVRHPSLGSGTFDRYEDAPLSGRALVAWDNERGLRFTVDAASLTAIEATK